MVKLLENIGTVNSKSGSVPDAGIIFIVQKLKTALENFGSHGLIGLQRAIRIFDDDGSKALSIPEFKKAMKEIKVGLSESEMRMLFSFFDKDSSGTINFEEFIQAVRDPLRYVDLSV
jgi:hypothetical protein